MRREDLVVAGLARAGRRTSCTPTCSTPAASRPRTSTLEAYVRTRGDDAARSASSALQEPMLRRSCSAPSANGGAKTGLYVGAIEFPESANGSIEESRSHEHRRIAAEGRAARQRVGACTCCSRCRSSSFAAMFERWLYFRKHGGDGDALREQAQRGAARDDDLGAAERAARERALGRRARDRARRCASAPAAPEAVADAVDSELGARPPGARARAEPARHARQQRAVHRPVRHGDRRHRGVPPARRGRATRPPRWAT